MFPIRQFAERFGEILSELDELANAAAGGEAAEDLEDLNAELEDAILLLSELRPEGEDWREELTGTLEDLRALAGDYCALAGDIPDVAPLAQRLEMAAELALGSAGNEA